MLCATRTLVLTGSWPPLLSDRQDVGCTFTSLRLWFLSCQSCFFLLCLHSLVLLKNFSYDGVILSTEGQEHMELEKGCLLLHLLLYPPYSFTINLLFLSTFILPSRHALHDLPYLYHSSSMFFPLVSVLCSFRDLLRRGDLAWVTDSWARIH